MTSQPSADEIREFLDIWQRLCDFEAAQRTIRGQGIFDESAVLPIPACLKMYDWLESLCEDEKG